MKTLFSFLFFSISLALVAQPNNPQSGFGTQYFSSVNKIVNDIQLKGFKGVDDASIKYYQGFVSFQTQMNASLAVALNDTKSKIKTIGDYSTFIDNSKLGKVSKEYFKKFGNDLLGKDEAALAKYLEKLSEEIKTNVSLADAEKTMLLQVCDIIYTKNKSTLAGDAAKKPCNFYDENGHHVVSPGQCVGMMAAVGMVVGFNTCGVFCAFGGGIIFGVITAIAVC